MEKSIEWFILLRTKLIKEREYFKSKKDKRANKINQNIKKLNESIVELVVKQFNEEKNMIETWSQLSKEELEEMYGSKVDAQDIENVKEKLNNINKWIEVKEDSSDFYSVKDPVQITPVEYYV